VKSRLQWVVLALLCWPLVSLGETLERQLENGMKVIVKIDRRAPVVVSQIWYRVGASDEPVGLTGISHVLEHMMFKGSERYAPGEFSRIIAAHGGRENAFTGQDYTAYFQQLAADQLPIALALEADRMRNLTLPAEEFIKELNVVKEERRLRTEDKPTALTQEHFMAAAFMVSPYQNPIIGWMEDLDALTVEDVAAWYRQWYAPNNAILVVAGDVDAEEVFALAGRHFGGYARETLPARKPRREPAQYGERRMVMRLPAEQPILYLGYKVPSIQTGSDLEEVYALEVLAHILDGGESARLTRELMRGERPLAASVSASYSLYKRYDTLFTLAAIPAEGVEVALAEQALRQQIARLQQEEVTSDELARIKARVMASKVYELDSLFYQAMQIGQLESIDLDWRLSNEYLDRIAAVTPAALQAAARRYLVDDALTVAILEPRGKPAATLRRPLYARH
jgi:zinc protease